MVPSILLATSLLVLNANSEMMFLIRNGFVSKTKIQFTFCWTRFLNFADLFKLMYLYFWHLYMGLCDINGSKKRHHKGIPGLSYAPTVIDGFPPPVIPLSLSLSFLLVCTEYPQAWLTRSWWRVCCQQFCSSGRYNDRRKNRSSPVNKPGTHGHACRGAAWQPRAAGVTHRTSSKIVLRTTHETFNITASGQACSAYKSQFSHTISLTRLS